MVGNLHCLVHEQVPCVSTVPVRCPQEASVRDQKQITGFIAIIELPGDFVRNLVI